MIRPTYNLHAGYVCCTVKGTMQLPFYMEINLVFRYKGNDVDDGVWTCTSTFYWDTFPEMVAESSSYSITYML
jgi:hypothetical protein